MNRPHAPTQTVSGLLEQLTSELSLLFRQECLLARTELSQSLSRWLSSWVALAGGIAVLFAGFLLLLTAAVSALTAVAPLWLAALSVGLVTGGCGWALAAHGRGQLRDAHLTPSRLPQSLRRDREVLLRRQLSR
jgi:zinc transporter ZupT